jgi:hypothetical protein
MYRLPILILILYTQLTFKSYYFYSIIVAIMLSNSTIKSAKRRAPIGYSSAKKRAKGTVSYPIIIKS